MVEGKGFRPGLFGMGFLRLLRRGIPLFGEDFFQNRFRIVRQGHSFSRGLELGWGVADDAKKMQGRCVGQAGNSAGHGMASGANAPLDDAVCSVSGLDNQVFQRGSGNIEQGETRACCNDLPNRIHQRDMGAVITKAGNGCFGAVIGHLCCNQQGGDAIGQFDIGNVKVG